MIYNNLISGLEGEVLTRKDLQVLEKSLVKLARKALGSYGYYEKEGVWQQKSGQQVLAKLQLRTVEAELRIRRLKWLQKVILYPEDHVQFRAAIFGQACIDNRRHARLAPWGEQMTEDL